MNIEINKKVLGAVVKYVNAKNKASRADFPVISVDDIVNPKVRGDNIVILVNGGIKGLAKYAIPYSNLSFRKGRPPKEKEEAEIGNLGVNA